MLNKNKKNIGLKRKRIKTLNIFLINSKVAIVVPYIELYGINKEGGAKRMNSNEIYVSLDIGTSNVKVIIGEMVNDSLNIIGVGNVKSNGLKKGSIVDIDETVRSIKKQLNKLSAWWESTLSKL